MESFFCPVHARTISFPKGVKANDANLKCCFANGTPMMVMNSSAPKSRWVRLIQMPPTRIQTKLKIM